MEQLGSFNLQHLIGKSTFSNTEIFLTKKFKKDCLCVLKLTDLDNTSTEKLEIITNELRMNRNLSHKNIYTHNDCFTIGSKLLVIGDLMKFGSCTDVINSHFLSGIPERPTSFILKSVLKALKYLHSCGIIHRGVKGGHILISDGNLVKLGGNRNCVSFISSTGKAKMVHKFLKHDHFYLPWMSPESLQQNMEGYQSKSDIYSLGITACELANGFAPFTDMPSTQMLLDKLQGTKPCLLDQKTMPTCNLSQVDVNSDPMMQFQLIRQSRLFSNGFHDFVSQCLNRYPSHRPPVNKLLQHKFFDQSAGVDLTKELQPLLPINELSQLNDDDQSSTDLNLKISELKLDEWDFKLSTSL